MKDLNCDIESDHVMAVTESTGVNQGNSSSRTHFPVLHQFLEQALGRNQVMGAVVLVAHQGQVVLSYVGGWADKEKARPMHEDTVFRLGSLSKSVSSWLALCLSGNPPIYNRGDK